MCFVNYCDSVPHFTARLQEGESALMKACARGYFGITQLIIAHKAILDLKSRVRCQRVTDEVTIIIMFDWS